MKQILQPVPGGLRHDSSLQQLVNSIIQRYSTTASNHHTAVINDITINAGTVPSDAANMINDLLSTVVNNSRNGEIYITAERYQDVVTVQIQERNNYNGYALSYSVGSLATEAAALGGFLSIKGPQQKITTISFSFPDHQAA